MNSRQHRLDPRVFIDEFNNLTEMSYSILEINGTKISRRFITNIWWKRKNPYLWTVVGCDDSLIENKYRYLPLSDACFSFLIETFPREM